MLCVSGAWGVQCGSCFGRNLDLPQKKSRAKGLRENKRPISSHSEALGP